MRFGARNQKINNVISQVVVTRQMVQLCAGSVARQWVLHHLGQSARRIVAIDFVAIAHEQNSIGQQNSFVHIVRNHENRLLRLANNAHEFILNGAARQRIQSTKGLVQQQHLGLNGKGPCNAHALLHAARQLAGLFVDGWQQAHHVNMLFNMLIDLRAFPIWPFGLHSKGNVLPNRQPRHERVTLKHHTALQTGPRNFTAIIRILSAPIARITIATFEVTIVVDLPCYCDIRFRGFNCN